VSEFLRAATELVILGSADARLGDGQLLAHSRLRDLGETRGTKSNSPFTERAPPPGHLKDEPLRGRLRRLRRSFTRPDGGALGLASA